MEFQRYFISDIMQMLVGTYPFKFFNPLFQSVTWYGTARRICVPAVSAVSCPVCSGISVWSIIFWCISCAAKAKQTLIYTFNKMEIIEVTRSAFQSTQ